MILPVAVQVLEMLPSSDRMWEPPLPDQTTFEEYAALSISG
jgi:hypothetical protein